MSPTVHTCPGCPTRIPANRIACVACHRRLPRKIRRALVMGRRCHRQDHEPLLNAITAARAWWADNRREAR